MRRRGDGSIRICESVRLTPRAGHPESTTRPHAVLSSLRSDELYRPRSRPTAEGSLRIDSLDLNPADTDRLYEYWLFFKLLDVFNSHLHIAPPSPEKFLAASEEGLFVRLRAGRSFSHAGLIEVAGRRIGVRFSYNRTFAASAPQDESGSWSLAMRPDFTVTLWPAALEENVAERLFLSLHLHFDSKYRLDSAHRVFEGITGEMERIKSEEKKGSYKRADLLVAHTYLDAIRRSGGAYVLFPGVQESLMVRRQYCELLPSIGAFPVRPTTSGKQTGIEAVGELLVGAVRHYANRLSARETIGFATWKAIAIREESRSAPWMAKMPEAEDGKRLPPFASIIASECEPCFSIEWIRKTSKYPIRIKTSQDGRTGVAALLNADAVIFPLRDEAEVQLLAPFDRSFVEILDSTRIHVPGQFVTAGIYAMLPLNLDLAVRLVGRGPGMVDALRARKICAATEILDFLEVAAEERFR